VTVQRDEFEPLVESWAYLNASRNGIIIANENSEILYVNTAMSRISGYDTKALLEMTISCLIPTDVDHPHKLNLSKFTNQQEGPTQMEPLGSVPLKRADGTIINVSVERRAYGYGERRRFSGVVRPVD